MPLKNHWLLWVMKVSFEQRSVRANQQLQEHSQSVLIIDFRGQGQKQRWPGGLLARKLLWHCRLEKTAACTRWQWWVWTVWYMNTMKTAHHCQLIWADTSWRKCHLHLEMRELRSRELKWLAQDHTARRQAGTLSLSFPILISAD